MLKQGSRGEAVKALQRKLGITPDGIFGPQTRAAVLVYQRANGLDDDGIAGPLTLGKMGLAGGGGSGGGGGGGAPAPAAPAINEQEMAARYGWALSVLNSDPSLRDAFNRAVRESWAPERFVAEVRNTPWYKNNSEAMRQAAVLKNSDPATWNQRVEQTRATIGRLGADMGATWDANTFASIADQALTFGWNDDQIRRAVGNYVAYSGGQLHGQAQQYETELRSYAASMGVRVGFDTILNMVRSSVSGTTSIETAKGQIQNMAESAFPHLAERIRSGETIADIASPYRQAMGQILEVNPESVDLFDPTIRGALAGQSQDGKPAMKTIWEFENSLRKDKRWLKTSNAREQAMGTARQVLSDFGLAV